MADSPVPMLSPATHGDTTGMTDSAPQGVYAQREMQAPAIVYGAAPGVSNGIPVMPAMIVPPDQTQPTPPSVTTGA
jgi:hypothetical protein